MPPQDPRDVARVALLDQARAASDEAVAFLDAYARVVGGRTSYTYPTPAVEALLRRFFDGALVAFRDQRSILCAHISRTSPSLAFWMPAPPGRPQVVRCQSCQVAYEATIKGTDTDRQCDLCGAIESELIWPMSFVIPPIVLDVPSLKLSGAPAVLVTAGLCDRCHAASASGLGASRK